MIVLETQSEKILKDSLNYQLKQSNLIEFQKVSTPRYQLEPIDFYIHSLDGRTHCVEVKETGSTTSITPNRFNDVQWEIMTHPILNEPDAHTRSWILAYFFDGDRTKRSTSSYYEYYFIVPGIYADEDHGPPLSIEDLHQDERATLIGEWRHGSYHGISEDYGLSTKMNPTLGFSTLPLLGNNETS